MYDVYREYSYIENNFDFLFGFQIEIRPGEGGGGSSEVLGFVIALLDTIQCLSFIPFSSPINTEKWIQLHYMLL